MKSMRRVGCAVMVLMAGVAFADVRLPRIFSDNMMLQRDQPIRVWGWAAPGEAVSVSLAGKSAATKADAKGGWLVELPALKEGENLELTVTGKNSVVIKNVIMGDIWLCSGQSNMEMALGSCLGARDDAKTAEFPKIRRIKIGHVTSPVPRDDVSVEKSWQTCTPQMAGNFTAVGFYFAREIQAKTGVPIGILDDNWNGTRIEPWTAPEGMEAVPGLHAAVVAKRNALVDYYAQTSKGLDELEHWLGTARAAAAAREALPPMPALPGHPWNSGWCSQYNAMIYPLTRFPIKGALWYQGESNGTEGDSYRHKLHALVEGWRQVWGQSSLPGGAFPFYFVQLASYQDATQNPAGGDGWATLREAQFKALDLPNSGMAVIIDTVPLKETKYIHPVNKYDVGLRLARWALNRDYGQKDLVPSGPLYKAMKVEGDKVRLSFDYAGSGLMVGTKSGRDPVVEVKEGKLKRFALAGADQKWVWADAVIDGTTVVVSSPQVKEPVAVRYAFSMNPDGANLYNREGLPASPFRTDSW